METQADGGSATPIYSTDRETHRMFKLKKLYASKNFGLGGTNSHANLPHRILVKSFVTEEQFLMPIAQGQEVVVQKEDQVVKAPNL